ncbi:hypothetical protein NM688_g3938 [Phlebia brevispora]|uniref:Uncharacterized protein n=1 Tax=Phlebia brevispora TaxID=194682 RepID=A0ACC1T4Y8_9APHY|nr:hypothetical protein NM688_g3938 [Phlebia brevispora]
MARSRTALVHELVQEPFGPYWHDDVLDAKKCKSTANNVLALTNVMFACGNMPVGLTQVECSQPEYDPDILDQGDVLVRGVLEIESDQWLSEYGRKVVQEELRRRDTQRRIEGGWVGGYTLEWLYGDVNWGESYPARVKLLIQGVKKKPAAHMTSDLLRKGLAIYLENKDNTHRTFHVCSMDAETYSRSRKYLGRYRLLRDMRDLVERYNEENKPNKILLEELTPEWYVEQYLEHKASMPSFIERRIIYDSDEDSDIEPGYNGQLKEDRTRKLRHVSHAEIYSLFAMHCSWLIHDQSQVKQRKSRIIDVEQWRHWRRTKYNKWRERSREENPRTPFGVFDVDDEESVDDDGGEDVSMQDVAEEQDPMQEEEEEEEEEAEEEGNLIVVKQEEDQVEQVPSSRRSSRIRKREDSIKVVSVPRYTKKVHRRVQSPPSETTRSVPPTPSLSRSISHSTRVAPPSPEVLEAQSDDERSYDSELSDSEDSTPPWSDSDDSLPPRSDTPLIPTLLARIPMALRYLPELPPHDFTWCCSVQNCKYEINLAGLTEEQQNALPDAEVAFITSPGWTFRDGRTQNIMRHLMSAHYEWHLNEEGIKVCTNNRGKIELCWATPEAHPNFQVLTGRRRDSVTVKEEE